MSEVLLCWWGRKVDGVMTLQVGDAAALVDRVLTVQLGDEKLTGCWLSWWGCKVDGVPILEVKS